MLFGLAGVCRPVIVEVYVTRWHAEIGAESPVFGQCAPPTDHCSSHWPLLHLVELCHGLFLLHSTIFCGAREHVFDLERLEHVILVMWRGR